MSNPVKKLQLYGTFPTTPGPQGPKGDTGATGPQGPKGDAPVKGVDYFTEADKTEMVEAALAELPISVSDDGYTDISGIRQVTGTSVVKEGDTITIVRTLEGGVTSVTTVTLDASGYPSKIVTDGVECPATWEGFDE